MSSEDKDLGMETPQSREEGARWHVLQAIGNHEDNSPALVSTQDIAEELRMTEKDVEYACEVLEHQRLVKVTDGPGFTDVSLTTEGKMRLREGISPGPPRGDQSIVTHIDNRHGSIENFAPNLGGIQSNRVTQRTAKEQNMAELLQRLRDGIEDVDIEPEAKEHARHEARQLDLELKRKPPRLARLSDNVDVIAGIAKGLGTIGASIIELAKMIPGIQ